MCCLSVASSVYTSDENTELVASDFRQNSPRFNAEARKSNLAFVDLLKDFASTKNATPTQIALAWLLAKKPWIVPIPGTTKLAHLQENLWAMDYQFTSGELNQITAEFDRITIVGDRYTGQSARRVNK